MDRVINIYMVHILPMVKCLYFRTLQLTDYFKYNISFEFAFKYRDQNQSLNDPDTNTDVLPWTSCMSGIEFTGICITPMAYT